jgi:HK97 family phage portal protein
MTWWERIAAEVRSLWTPWTPNVPSSAFLGPVSLSGEPVTAQRAASLTAVWACVSLISGCISSMPLILYRRTADDGRERAVEHSLYDVLRVRPNPVQSCQAFYESLVTSVLLRGNGYATVTRDDTGAVRALWFVSPDRVSVELLPTGRLRYRVTTPSGPTLVPDGSMLHVMGPLSADGYLGASVISCFKETLGLSLAQERFSGEYFSNAAVPRGVLTTPRALGDTARARLTTALAAAHDGPGKRFKTLLLEEGMAWQALGLSNEDSQLLESRKFSIQEIARIFGVPAHMLSGEVTGSLTYSNAETRALDFLKYSLGPWLARLESAINYTCIAPLERKQLYVEFLADSLLSTDTTSRYSAYKIGLDAGFLTLDEVRRRENLPALDQVPPVG